MTDTPSLESALTGLGNTLANIAQTASDAASAHANDAADIIFGVMRIDAIGHIVLGLALTTGAFAFWRWIVLGVWGSNIADDEDGSFMAAISACFGLLVGAFLLCIAFDPTNLLQALAPTAAFAAKAMMAVLPL